MSWFPFSLDKYLRYTPSFSYVKQRFFNGNINIDHVAHRSFNYQPLTTFYQNNWFRLQKEQYFFPHMNVKAIWLQHPNSTRVFLSQYEGKNETVIHSYEDYTNIQKKSDYVAWTLLHKQDINHVAIQVNNLEEILYKIKKDGKLQLNQPEQPISSSVDGKLLQASTVADKIGYRFPNGEVHMVPYAFVEFVERIDGREGFETRNAATIFTSTHLKPS